MNIIDILLIFLMALAMIRGFFKGIVVEFFSLLAFILGIWLCLKINPALIESFKPLTGQSEWGIYLVYVLLFVVTYFLVFLIGKWLEQILKFAGLNIFNRLMGSFFGLLKVLFFLSLIAWLSAHLELIPGRVASESYFFEYVASFAPFLLEKSAEIFPFLHGVVENTEQYLEQILHELQSNQNE